MTSTYRLGDLVDIFDGPHATPKKTEDGPVFLGISNLVAGRLDLTVVEHLSEDDYLRWTRRVEPRRGDVVFSYETRLGEAASIPDGLRCCLGRRMGLLRAKSGRIDPRFLLYGYLGPDFQEVLRSRTVRGSTVDRIPLIEMPEFPMRVPPIHEQQAIASILGALDDKIELNRQMNETLEELARTIFKSWFVDFDPVRVKAEGRQPVGIDAEMAALFPSRFVESELGEIPEGWDVSTLGELCRRSGGEIQTGPFGSQLHASDYVEDGVPSVMPKDLKEDRISQAGIARIREEDAQRLSRYRLRSGDIVYSRRGDVERCALVSDKEAGWLCGTGCLRVRLGGGSDADPIYVFGAVTTERARSWVVRHAHGATMPNLNTSILGQLPLVTPVGNVQRAYRSMIGPLLERRDHNWSENETLAAVRDLLLPRLISGELRIPEAEKFVEDVA